MKSYKEMKASVRAKAQEMSMNLESMSWGECCERCDMFERLGRRYGLLREFRENGIC